MKFIKIAIIALSVILLPQTAHASELTTTIVSPDDFYNANFIISIKHPDQIQCDWGSVLNEFRPDGFNDKTICKFDIKYTISFVENLQTGYEIIGVPRMPSPGFNSPDGVLTVVDMDGKNVAAIQALEPETYYLSGDLGKEYTKTISYYFSKPLKLRFNFTLGAYDKVRKNPIVVNSQSISVTGKTTEEAIAAYKSAQIIEIARINAIQKAKLLKITCVKGKVKKIIQGDPPKCPSGFTNPAGSLATYKAFATCKLYKKDNQLVNAQLSDNSHTLKFNTIGIYESSAGYNFATMADFRCANSVMKVPDFVLSQISSTRAIDGLQKANWGKVSAFWTYHPDSGLNITFNTK